jgi:hypothetical protein
MVSSTDQASTNLSGRGNQVVLIESSTRKAAISNIRDSNFAETVYPLDGRLSDLVVNTIGS